MAQNLEAAVSRASRPLSIRQLEREREKTVDILRVWISALDAPDQVGPIVIQRSMGMLADHLEGRHPNRPWPFKDES